MNCIHLHQMPWQCPVNPGHGTHDCRLIPVRSGETATTARSISDICDIWAAATQRLASCDVGHRLSATHTPDGRYVNREMVANYRRHLLQPVINPWPLPARSPLVYYGLRKSRSPDYRHARRHDSRSFLVFLLRQREWWRSIAMSASVYLSVCLSVCMCVSVRFCLSVCSRAYLSNYTRNHYNIFVHVAYGLGSVLFRPSVAIPRGRDNFGSFFPIYNALYEPYSGINFATKYRFGLNLLIYCKVGQNLIYYY